ncbi:unnamed protein product [Tetraodon nigroviridis]|uniref:(spotted green pufferfish) hypothetical protein n=1 Tax=Tetraodon nigroviridis TaxID=99883 RepID=Q4SUS4_TETNG|nr:unnamed protein product [Tetraodon nigroviridis]
METEYRQSYQDPVPPAKPRLRKHLEAQRIPLFHVHMDKKTKASQKKPHGRTAPSHHRDEATPPAQVQRPRRLTEYQSSFRSPLRRDPGGGRGHARPRLSG